MNKNSGTFSEQLITNKQVEAAIVKNTNSECSLTIGIGNLTPCYSSIEKNGLFIVTAPIFNYSKSILVQTILSNPTTKTALISLKDDDELFKVSEKINKRLFKVYESGNLLLNFANKNQTETLFNDIAEDIKDEAFESIDLILIDLYQEIIAPIQTDELALIISSWQNWLIRQKKTCVWFIHGDQASEFIKSKTSTLHNMFNGLAAVKFNYSDIEYEVLFWHLYSSIQTKTLLKLQFNEIKYEISVCINEESPYETTQLLSLSDDDRVLVIKSEDVLEEMYPREWIVLSDFEALETKVSNDSSATIIIYINAAINIAVILSKVLNLRIRAGRQLKIILRETERCLRVREERLLIDAGANLIAPYNVGFLRFVTMVYATQGSYFTRNIPHNINEARYVEIGHLRKNFLPIAEFINQSILLVENSQHIKINSSLLKFVIDKSIAIEELVALIKIKRDGDIFTLTENCLYIFLFQCEKSGIKNALAHIFPLPVDDLFLAQRYFSVSDAIKDELELLGSEKHELPYKLDNNQQLQFEHNTKVAYKKVIRQSARPTPLTLMS
jgi:cellulose biosynthesis protein BcsE